MLTALSSRRIIRAVVALLLVAAADPTWAGEVPAAAREQLATAKYVYISSTRKDGALSKPAEIWFLVHDGAVYVGTPPTTWRARRIKAGRPQAKIWVGKPDGPSFTKTTWPRPGVTRPSRSRATFSTRERAEIRARSISS